MLKVLNSFDHMNITIYPEGILDYCTVEIFDYFIESIFESYKDFTHIIIDFSRVSFIDSTGIGAILRSIYISLENGCTFEISGMNDDVHDIFETMGLPRVLASLQRGALLSD